jgi:hypothetical protein
LRHLLVLHRDGSGDQSAALDAVDG